MIYKTKFFKKDFIEEDLDEEKKRIADEEIKRADEDLAKLRAKYKANGFIDFPGYDKEIGVPYVQFIKSEKPLTEKDLADELPNLIFVELVEIKPRKITAAVGGHVSPFMQSLDDILG